jgi:hypothetical protein
MHYLQISSSNYLTYRYTQYYLFLENCAHARIAC